ncbi:GGDEF domain-containing protein [Aquabacterium sp.]|uniref:GGDEF domain-containing protein n=1 Tax=Aquabacterium sp. TaxID=1872578 RepID=UPI0035B050B0
MHAFPSLDQPTLMVVIVTVMAAISGVMTFIGQTQRVYRGYWLWTASQWLYAAGVALQLLRDDYPPVAPISTALMLQWPILWLWGTRRFYARSTFPAPMALDALMLAGAYMLWLMAWTSPYGAPARMAAFSIAACALHGYVFWSIYRIREWRVSASLQGLSIFMLVTAAVQVPRVVASIVHWGDATVTSQDVMLPWVNLLMLCGAVFMVYLCVLLTYERTERGLRDTQRQLRVLADIDMLTQVPNRRHFYDLAEQVLKNSPPASASVMLFDIDFFKLVNDTHGHAAGDLALRDVAHAARLMLRSRDVVGRIGGDEFVSLLPETSLHDAMQVADRIMRHVDAVRRESGAVPLSLSFGVVQTLPGESLTDALHRADLALYEAKRQGRHRAVAAEHEDGHPVFTHSQPLSLT